MMRGQINVAELMVFVIMAAGGITMNVTMGVGDAVQVNEVTSTSTTGATTGSVATTTSSTASGGHHPEPAEEPDQTITFFVSVGVTTVLMGAIIITACMLEKLCTAHRFGMYPRHLKPSPLHLDGISVHEEV